MEAADADEAVRAGGAALLAAVGHDQLPEDVGLRRAEDVDDLDLDLVQVDRRARAGRAGRFDFAGIVGAVGGRFDFAEIIAAGGAGAGSGAGTSRATAATAALRAGAAATP